MRTRVIVLLGLVVLLSWSYRDRIAVSSRAARYWIPYWWAYEQRVYDDAGIVPSYEEEELERVLNLVFLEQGLDVRAAYVRGLGGVTLEDHALVLLESRRIGAATGRWRGLLFVYDAETRRIRIEVGYGLEEYVPDVLVSYLLHEHAIEFFQYGDAYRAVAWTLPLLLDRMRRAGLDGTYDPIPLDVFSAPSHLGAGAGAQARIPIAHARATPNLRGTLPGERRGHYTAAPSAEDAFQRYLEWLGEPWLDPTVEILTSDSRAELASAPVSRVVLDYALASQRGRAHAIDVRGNVALLYFTGDPIASPLFFSRSPGGWQIDLHCDFRNLRRSVGGPYAWSLVDTDDVYARAFRDRFVTIDGFVRLIGGDNRRYRTRWRYW